MVNEYFQGCLTHSKSYLSMIDVKKLGGENVSHYFENNRYSDEVNVYWAGISGEDGGI